MSAVAFPILYRIAYSDGEGYGVVPGVTFREFWQAECALNDLHDAWPNLLFWITWKP